jgi:hypothetical protein
MEHGSGGLYQTGSVRNWIEKNLKTSIKTESEWYWLEPDEIMAFFRVAEKIVGQYWADAMTIQYYLGLRPEELPLLQSKNVIRGKRGRITHVYVAPLKDADELVRRVKTSKSVASMPVKANACSEALRRRLAKHNILLFPRDHTECGGRAPQWARCKRSISEFERKTMLWHIEKWDKVYITKLREVIAAVPSIDKNRFDARSLRRTRGKDVYLQTKSADLTAAFLRDSAKTVESHYAKLLPRDFRDLK